jgi:nitrite reductase/ring-hydroxylating ferredoxin subunit
MEQIFPNIDTNCGAIPHRRELSDTSEKMSVETKILHLPPYPSSWYLVCTAEELKKGEVRSMVFCGQETVAYRTESGKVLMTGAYCAHMGAHLGKGGIVEGENIRCPFHGFCFDPTGACVKTGYDTRPPLQAKLRTWPVREVNGLIMAWQDENGKAPDWQIPALDWQGWSPLRFENWVISSHPQEIAENSADTGHFIHVHGYDNVKVFQEATVDGPRLHGRYGMSRVANFIGKGGKLTSVEFDFAEWGLGYALVEAEVPAFELKTRHFVFPTPIDGKQIHLRIAASVHENFAPGKIHPLLSLVPRKILFPFVCNGVFKGYRKDVSDDFQIWTNKAYIHPPALAQGDGPVIRYRKWAEQFYAVPPAVANRS